VASAGPHANHIAPDGQPCKHLITHFLLLDAELCQSTERTNSHHNLLVNRKGSNTDACNTNSHKADIEIWFHFNLMSSLQLLSWFDPSCYHHSTSEIIIKFKCKSVVHRKMNNLLKCRLDNSKLCRLVLSSTVNFLQVSAVTDKPARHCKRAAKMDAQCGKLATKLS